MCSHEDLVRKVLLQDGPHSQRPKLSLFCYVVPHTCTSRCALEIKDDLVSWTDAITILHGSTSSVSSVGTGNSVENNSLITGIRAFCRSPTLLVSTLTSAPVDAVIIAVMDRESDHKLCNAFVRECFKRDIKSPHISDGTRTIVFVGRKPMKALQELDPTHVVYISNSTDIINGCAVSWVQGYVSSHNRASSKSLPVESLSDLVELICVVHYSNHSNHSSRYLSDVLAVVTMLVKCSKADISLEDVQAVCEAFFKRHMVFAGNRKPRVVRLDLLSFKTTQ